MNRYEEAMRETIMEAYYIVLHWDKLFSCPYYQSFSADIEQVLRHGALTL